MKFKTSNGVIYDPVDFILRKKMDQPDLKVHIGTDSVYRSGTIYYIEVIAARYENSGADYIYRKSTLPGYKKSDGKPDIFQKLWQEARLTIELGIEIRQTVPVDVLEFDYNHVKGAESNKVIAAARGWALSEGFNILYKRGFDSANPWSTQPDVFESPNPRKGMYIPNTLISAKAADHICQGIKKR